MTVSVNQILEAQAHIGTLKNEAHPKTSKYWSEVTNGVVVINPEILAQQLETARATIQKAKAEGKEILVVCEKKMYATELEALAKKSGVSFLNYKVSGGFLTNFATYKKRIDSINEMAEFMQSDAYAALTKIVGIKAKIRTKGIMETNSKTNKKNIVAVYRPIACLK